MRYQHPDPDFSHPYCPIHIHVYSSNLTSERPSCPIANSAQFELLRTQQHETQHQTRLGSCITDENAQDRARIILIKLFTSPESTSLALETWDPHNQRNWSFLKSTHSLSLSRKLLQQRAKPNIRRSERSRSWSRSPCYQATESLHLLLFYSYHLNIVYFLRSQLLLLIKRD
jgi:hypothetical protein